VKRKAALVLSGGGARGIAHIGVIDELEKHGYEITSIAGTSMGSLVGGVYALGKLEAFREWITTLDKLKVFRMVDFTLSKQGLIKGDKVLNKMKDFIPDTRIEDLPIPYVAVAVDLINKEEVVLDSGSLYEAIRASIAIPSVLTPVKRDQRLLVDGGVLNNVPVNHVPRTRGDVVVAVNVNADVPPLVLKEDKEETERKQNVYKAKMKEFYKHLGIPSGGEKEGKEEKDDPELEEKPGRMEKPGYFSVLNRTLDLMTNQMSELIMEQHKPDILINISRETCHIYDFYRAEELIETGRQTARKLLQE
jgi:NTE family protein